MANKWDELIAQGPPEGDPGLPPDLVRDEEARQKWSDDLAQAAIEDSQKAAEEAQAQTQQQAEAPIGVPALDAAFKGIQEQGLTMRAATPAETPGSTLGKAVGKLPADVAPPTPDNFQVTDVGSVEQDPSKRDLINTHLQGLSPRVQDRLIKGYGDALGAGKSPQEAYRALLIQSGDAMRGTLATGWPEYPNGAPNEDFWARYLGFDPNDAQGAPAGMQGVKTLKAIYDKLRTEGTPDLPQGAAKGDLVKQRWEAMGVQGKGPLEPFDAFAAMRELEKEWFPRGRPEAAMSFGDLFLNAAVFAPLGGASMVAAGVAAPVVGHNLPEGTPDAVKTTVEFGVYGAAGPGGLAARAKSALSLGLAAGAGQEAGALGKDIPVVGGGLETAGAMLGPVLAPGTAALARRQFAWAGMRAIAEPAEKGAVDSAIKRLAVDLKPDNIGAHVAIGDQIGTVTHLPSKDLIGVQLQNGLQVIVRRDEALALPLAGKSATVATAGETAAPLTAPMELTPESLAEMPMGRVMVHFTPQENVNSILREGFRPSGTQGGLDFSGVYLVPQGNQGMEWFSGIFGTKERVARKGPLTSHEGEAAVFGEIPNGPIATLEQVDDQARKMGIRAGDRKSGSMQEVQDALIRQGFVGAEQGLLRGVAIFDAATVKPRMGTTLGQDWATFNKFADGVMGGGDINARLIPSIAGAATPTSWGSPVLNQLLDFSLNTAYDAKIFRSSMTKGAVARTVPGSTAGQVWRFAKSITSPGERRLTQPQFLAASINAEQRGARIALQDYTGEKLIAEAFGKGAVDATHKGEVSISQLYKGPPPNGRAGDADIGHLVDAVYHPDWYNLTPQMKDALHQYDVLFSNDAEHLRKNVGLDFKTIQGAYVPLRVADNGQSWIERLMQPGVQREGAVGGPARPFFTKERKTPDNRGWSELLSTTGDVPERNLFKLANQRLQASARLEADQVYLQSVVKQYGEVVADPQIVVDIRQSVQKMQGQLRGKLTTAIRRDVRVTQVDQFSHNLDKLLTQVDRELGRVDAKLATSSPIVGNEFASLEGALKALDKEADRVAGFSLAADEAGKARTVDLATTKTEVAALRARIQGARARLAVYGRAEAPRGWTEIGQGRLSKRWAVPDDIAREVRLAMSPTAVNPIQAGVEDTIQFFRQALLSSDLSGFSKQGYDLFTADPMKGMQRFANAAMVATSHEGFMVWMAHNFDGIQRFTNAGGTFHMSATDAVKGLARGTSLPAPARQIAGALTAIPNKLDEVQYGRFIPMMKTTQFTSLVDLLTHLQNDEAGIQMFSKHIPVIGNSITKFFKSEAGLANASQHDIEAAAADMVNNIGGGVNWAKAWTRPDLWQSAPLLTPGWLRANVGRIVDAARVGDPRGVLARRFLFQNLGISAMISTMFSLAASGRLPTYDPTAGDFLDVQVGPQTEVDQGGSIPFMPDKTYIRTIMQAIMGQGAAFSDQPYPLTKPIGAVTGKAAIDSRLNTLFRFGEGRLAQLPRLGMDEINGTDIFGRKIDNRLLYAMKNILPIAGQGILDTATGSSPGAGLTGIGAIDKGFGVGMQAAGLNWVPRNPFDVRDRAIALKGNYLDAADPAKSHLTSYGALTDSQRQEWDKLHPEYSAAVARWQEERDSPFAALRGIRNEQRGAVDALGKAFRGEPLSDDEKLLLGPDGANLEPLRNNARLYRQTLSNLGDYYRQKSDKASSGSVDFKADSASQEVVQGYYKEVIDKAKGIGGALDYTLKAANERAYRRFVDDKYGQAGLDVLDQELLYRVSDDPVAHAYHKDSLLWETYFNHLDSFWTPTNLQASGFSAQAAEAASNFPNKEQYGVWLSQSYAEQLAFKPLSDALYRYRSTDNGDTLGKKWGVIPGQRLTEQQARDIAEELTRVQLKGYNDRITVASDAFLKVNPDTLCAASYWEIIEPSQAMRPYLGMCKTSRVPH